MLAMMPNRTMKERVYTEISNYDACFYKFKGVANNISDLLKVAEGNAVKDTLKSALDKIGRQFLFGDEKEGVEEIIMKSIAQKEHGEVFTPSFLVNEILDEFEKRYPDFFANPNHTVLDFAAGAGNLLKEVVKRFYNKTRHLYTSDDDCMRHILTNQIYAVEIQANNYQMFCKNIDPKGLVPDNPHFVCANALGFDYWDMMYNFDMTFINPPYSISNGNGDGTKYKDTFQVFSMLAHNLSKRFVINIIPSKFLYSANDEFTKYFFSLNNVVFMKTYHKPKYCFDANVSGGIVWYISDKKYYRDDFAVEEVDYNGNVTSGVRKANEFNVYPRTILGSDMLRKMFSKTNTFFDKVVMSTNVFGIETNYDTSLTKDDADTYEVLTNKESKYISKGDVRKNVELIDEYKYIMVRASTTSMNTGGVDGKMKIVSNRSSFVDKGVVFTDTFLCISHSKDREYIENVEKFFSTKFANYFLWLALENHHLSKAKFCFIPVMDFKEEWDDEKLYKFFEFTDEEIKEIETLIK